MNQPGRYEKFIIPDGYKKVTYEKDTKVQDAGTFIIQREDHTIGNLVRTQLHLDKDVNFAGYRVPHPLEHRIEIKIQTNGTCSPLEALSTSVQDLEFEFQDIKEQFKKEVDRSTLNY